MKTFGYLIGTSDLHAIFYTQRWQW